MTPQRSTTPLPAALWLGHGENFVASGYSLSCAIRTRSSNQLRFAPSIRTHKEEPKAAMYCPAPTTEPGPPLLDFALTYRKQRISQFLIDNFRGPQPEGSGIACQAFSNRPCTRLEMLVSHRKQTVAPTSNRPQFAFSIFPFVSASTALNQLHSLRSRLPTLNCRLSSLIANETHSRVKTNYCKYSTYKILIANEFHMRIALRRRQFELAAVRRRVSNWNCARRSAREAMHANEAPR